MIEAPELQTEVKKLISDSSGTYETILELIHQDYRAQETGDTLRVSTPASTLSSRRSKADTSANADVKPRPPRFPHNEGNLLPSHFYSQFKTWYQHMSVPKDQRNQETLEWIKTFKFEFRSPNSRRENGRNNHRNDHRDNSSTTPRRYDDSRDSGAIRGRRAEFSHDDYNMPSTTRSRSRSRSRERDDDYNDFLAWQESRSRSSRRAFHRGDDYTTGDVDSGRRRRVQMFRS